MEEKERLESEIAKGGRRIDLIKQESKRLKWTEAEYLENLRRVAEDIRVEIPETYMFGFSMKIEMPVAVAVEHLINESPVSSGFHSSLNQRWTMVFAGKVSPKVASAAKEAGLEVKERIPTAKILFTDISLPNVRKEECNKATKAFDKFAERYSGEKMPPREVVCKVTKYS